MFELWSKTARVVRLVAMLVSVSWNETLKIWQKVRILADG